MTNKVFYKLTLAIVCGVSLIAPAFVFGAPEYQLRNLVLSIQDITIYAGSVDTNGVLYDVTIQRNSHWYTGSSIEWGNRDGSVAILLHDANAIPELSDTKQNSSSVRFHTDDGIMVFRIKNGDTIELFVPRVDGPLRPLLLLHGKVSQSTSQGLEMQDVVGTLVYSQEKNLSFEFGMAKCPLSAEQFSQRLAAHVSVWIRGRQSGGGHPAMGVPTATEE